MRQNEYLWSKGLIAARHMLVLHLNLVFDFGIQFGGEMFNALLCLW